MVFGAWHVCVTPFLLTAESLGRLLKHSRYSSEEKSTIGRTVRERLFFSPYTLQDYWDKGVIFYTQIAEKKLYRFSDIN